MIQTDTHAVSRITSGMSSVSAAQHGTSVGCQLQPQICTHFPASGTFMKSVLCHNFGTRTANTNLPHGIRLVCHHKQVTPQL
jgi:hypothetical protein